MTALPQDVRVPQMALDFDFADDLMLHPVFPQLCFMEDFQPKDISTKPVTGEIDITWEIFFSSVLNILYVDSKLLY
jgi:hypothetical protein